jgi:GMP synthase C terminal domain
MLLAVRTLGVMSDGRIYHGMPALRPVISTDEMTADVFESPCGALTRAATRIINNLLGVNRARSADLGIPDSEPTEGPRRRREREAPLQQGCVDRLQRVQYAMDFTSVARNSP